MFGAIGAPGNDPSVITVGAVNIKSTIARSDDSVTLFSSRGPTRGAYVDAAGVRRIDNLIKPDRSRTMGAAVQSMLGRQCNRARIGRASSVIVQRAGRVDGDGRHQAGLAESVFRGNPCER